MSRVRYFGVCLLVLVLNGTVALAAPRPELWARWQAHATTQTLTVDHRSWDAFLARYVVTKNRMNLVNYRAVTLEDRAALDHYIDTLESTDVDRLTRNQQFAFWVNLYNGATVRLVLRHYPVKSIRDIDISPGLFSDGPWGAKILTVDGIKLSLDDIEHRILRPIWKDPRIHYAVNCASIGCPDLPRHAFRAKGLGDMLDAAARAYINHPRGMRIKDGRLIVSKLYKWYMADFGGTEAGVIAHLRRYAEPGKADMLATITHIDGYTYDWSLNDAGP